MRGLYYLPVTPDRWVLEALSSLEAEQRGEKYKALTFHSLAFVLSEHCANLGKFDLAQYVQTAIKNTRDALSAGIDDYGTWRATRGNPDFGHYAAAKATLPDDLRRIDKRAALAPDLVRRINDLVKDFGSPANLILACQLYRSILDKAGLLPDDAALNYSRPLSAEDISLCLAWAGHDFRTTSVLAALKYAVDHLPRYELCRLLSARAAELAAIAYYRNIGEAITDVSIGQLARGESDWQDYDILAGDRAIDIKNARASFHSPDTYVEHCVPKFKLNRKSGENVSIAGVFSEYIYDPQNIANGYSTSLMLGEVNIVQIRELFRWMRKRFGCILNLDGIWNPGFLAGWIFDYPEQQYAGREMVRRNVINLLDQFQKSCTPVQGNLPVWFLGYAPSHRIIDTLDLEPLQKKILADIASLQDGVGITRASVYVYCMGFLLEAILAEGDQTATFQVLGKILFPQGNSSLPLGVIDTKQYVANLIVLLKQVHDAARKKNTTFQAFHLRHPKILKGELHDGQWITVIAYCGGWIEEPFNIKCGTSPLNFGKNEVCPQCAKLICEKCGFCSDHCSGYHQRKQSFLRGLLPSRSQPRPDLYDDDDDDDAVP